MVEVEVDAVKKEFEGVEASTLVMGCSIEMVGEHTTEMFD